MADDKYETLSMPEHDNIQNYFRNNGYTKEATDGVFSNIRRESGVKAIYHTDKDKMFQKHLLNNVGLNTRCPSHFFNESTEDTKIIKVSMIPDDLALVNGLLSKYGMKV